MQSLVIVESPTKARTIKKFLGKDFIVEASMGHVVDLPKSSLGVDIQHNFLPQYEIVEGKKKIISKLKSLSKTADRIILATDPDREGEAIAANIHDLLLASLGKKAKQLKFERIVFHEITKEAVSQALLSPRGIDTNLVNAQIARRVLDRLVGYKLSPILWQKVRRGLSAGRVQSVALRLIVQREREIKDFQTETYYSISVLFFSDILKDKVEFELIEINGKTIGIQTKFPLYDGDYQVGKTSIDKKDQAEQIKKELEVEEYIVENVSEKQIHRTPQPPFTTSSLQQEANKKLGFSSKKTMMLAQKLYEEGLITYHRTDSVNLSSLAISSIREFIVKEYSEKFLSGLVRIYKTKQKLTQEAHEAIRPTNVGIRNVVQKLTDDHQKLYDIIWRRSIASQMADAVINSTTVTVKTKHLNSPWYRLKTSGSVLVFDGFLRVNPQVLLDRKLPKFEEGQLFRSSEVNVVEHQTPPPPRYNDASLIKTLEEKGIGRPSTYASIISTILSRQYVEKDNIRFMPTSIGEAVNDFLVKNFSFIDDIPFTSGMEDDLDNIAKGKLSWNSVIKDFFDPFDKTLSQVKEFARVKIKVEETNQKCPLCNNQLVIRTGRFGKFFSCSTFPACSFSKPFIQETNLICPRDGGKIIFKKTKKGRKFYGCSNYPKCTFAAWNLNSISSDKENAA